MGKNSKSASNSNKNPGSRKKSKKSQKKSKQNSIEPEPLNLEVIPELSEEERAAQLEKEQRLSRISEDLKRAKKEAGETFTLKLQLDQQLTELEAEREKIVGNSFLTVWQFIYNHPSSNYSSLSYL